MGMHAGAGVPLGERAEVPTMPWWCYHSYRGLSFLEADRTYRAMGLNVFDKFKAQEVKGERQGRLGRGLYRYALSERNCATDVDAVNRTWEALVQREAGRGPDWWDRPIEYDLAAGLDLKRILGPEYFEHCCQRHRKPRFLRWRQRLTAQAERLVRTCPTQRDDLPSLQSRHHLFL